MPGAIAMYCSRIGPEPILMIQPDAQEMPP